MTSPRRRPGSPVESVSLKITFRGRKEELAKIREAIPAAVVRGGTCQVSIESDRPAEVAERAKAVLEKLRSATRIERL